MKKLKVILMLIISIFLLVVIFFLFKNPKVFFSPLFVKVFVDKHPYGSVSKCTKEGKTIFILLSSLAPGSGSSLYQNNGVKITDCYIGPEISKECDLRLWQCENIFGKF